MSDRDESGSPATRGGSHKSFMLLIEPFEARLLLEGLLRMRKTCDEDLVWSEHEIDKLMYNVAIHAGHALVKDMVPEAYEICFPDGPPHVRGKYGTPGQ